MQRKPNAPTAIKRREPLHVHPRDALAADLPPPGTEVDGWRVGARHASGAYGTVYRAQRAHSCAPGLFALKLATWPKDPRFEREAAW